MRSDWSDNTEEWVKTNDINDRNINDDYDSIAALIDFESNYIMITENFLTYINHETSAKVDHEAHGTFKADLYTDEYDSIK